VLTRRGWLVLASAGASWLAGRLLGLLELHVVAVAAAAAVVGAAIYVRVVPFRLDARRQVRPTRVHLGQPGRVDLALTNVTTRRTPPLVAEEPFDDGRLVARFQVPSLGPGETGRAAYRIPTDRRGRFLTGPITLRLVDPFGLASGAATVGRASAVLVYPHIDAISGMPPAPGRDPHAGTHQRAGRLQGEDFYALRPYEVGDDLRRVHWPATARADDLMIRQLELPWQHRTTVLLDVRRAVHTPESFEEAVSAAASILTGSHRSGAVTRLATTAGLDSGFDASSSHWEAALAALAGVRLTGAANLARAVASLRRHGGGSSVAVITTGGASAGDLRAISALRERVGLVVMVLVEGPGQAATTGGSAPLRPVLPHQVRVVRVGPERRISTAWNVDARPAAGGGGGPVGARGPR
jgi:uncharacterized protein (DUF58 family)